MGVGNLGSLDNLFHRRILHTKGDIIVEGIVEEDSLLIDVTDQCTQFRDTYRLDILAVDEHLAILYVVIARNKVYQCRLTRT